jgi:hypothetical protein
MVYSYSDAPDAIEIRPRREKDLPGDSVPGITLVMYSHVGGGVDPEKQSISVRMKAIEEDHKRKWWQA